MRAAALLVLAIVTAAPAATLFRDTFTGADGTYMASHTPDVDLSGTGWQNVSGTAIIQGNHWATTGTVPGGIGVLWTTQSAANASVEMTLGAGWTGTSGASIVFRYAVSGGSHLLAEIKPSGQVRLYHYTGTWATLGSATVTYAGGAVLKVRGEGPNVKVYYNGVEIISVTSSVNQTSNLHGLQGGVNRTVNEFKITDLTPDVVPGPLAYTNSNGVKFEVAGVGTPPAGWPANASHTGDNDTLTTPYEVRDIYSTEQAVTYLGGDAQKTVNVQGGTAGVTFLRRDLVGTPYYFHVFQYATTNQTFRVPLGSAGSYWAPFQAAIDNWHSVNPFPATSGTDVTPDDPTGLRVQYLGKSNSLNWSRGRSEHEFTEFPRVFVREDYNADEWTVTGAGVLEWRGDSIGDFVTVAIEPAEGMPALCYMVTKTGAGGVARIYSDAKLFPASTPFREVRLAPAYSTFGITVDDDGVLDDPEGAGYVMLPGASRLMLRSWDGFLDKAEGDRWLWHNNLGEFTEEVQLAIKDRWDNWRAISFTPSGVAWAHIYDRPRMPEVIATLHPFNAILDVDPNEEECGPGTDDVNCDGFDDTEVDSDGDGIPDHLDPDDDNDGKHDCGDSDRDGLPNSHDLDDDNDGIDDWEDTDPDGDGLNSARDLDDDGDCIPDSADYDQDGDQVPDYRDGDLDGDGIPNDWDLDMDGDGIKNVDDNDNDADGKPDTYFPEGLRRVRGSITSQAVLHKNILGTSAGQY